MEVMINEQNEKQFSNNRNNVCGLVLERRKRVEGKIKEGVGNLKMTSYSVWSTLPWFLYGKCCRLHEMRKVAETSQNYDSLENPYFLN